jgi:hypothetical protein
LIECFSITKHPLHRNDLAGVPIANGLIECSSISKHTRH